MEGCWKVVGSFERLWEAFEKPWGNFGRLWLQHSMSLTEALGSFGSLWEVLGGFGRLWEARLWYASEGFGTL